MGQFPQWRLAAPAAVLKSATRGAHVRAGAACVAFGVEHFHARQRTTVSQAILIHEVCGPPIHLQRSKITEA